MFIEDERSVMKTEYVPVALQRVSNNSVVKTN